MSDARCADRVCNWVRGGPSLSLNGVRQSTFDRATVNPFQRSNGELLPRGTFRNHQEILVRDVSSFNLDTEFQAVVSNKISIFATHVVIACIVEGELQGLALAAWWESVGEPAAPRKVTSHRQVNPQFVYVGMDGQETTLRLLTRAFHQFNRGVSIY